MDTEKSAEITQSCPQGLTEDDLHALFPDPIERTKFNKWMIGQTGTICLGYEYDYDSGRTELTDCEKNPHGYITYRHDVEQYLRGGNPFD